VVAAATTALRPINNTRWEVAYAESATAQLAMNEERTPLS